ncbi:unnamed protein product [Arctogadus glacialis]
MRRPWSTVIVDQRPAHPLTSSLSEHGTGVKAVVTSSSGLPHSQSREWIIQAGTDVRSPRGTSMSWKLDRSSGTLWTLQRLHSPPPHRRQRDKDSAFVQRQEASDSVDGAATTPPPSAPGTVLRPVGQQLPNDPTRSSSGSFARTKEGHKGKVSGLGQGANRNKVRKHGGEEEGLVQDRLVEGTEEPVSSQSPDPSPAAGRQGRWKPLTVNVSCSHRDRRGGTPPPNVTKWFSVNRSYLCEPPWVTTVTITACAALRKCHGGCNSSW